MLHGLDLFSGIGGISAALAPWVRPVAYCEIDRYAQAVLLSRMCSGELPSAPVWDDIRTLRGKNLPEVDIIYGGFPCQDISAAGKGAGLEGERSGLFYEVVRLAKELKPTFIFLENVPAISTRGGIAVIRALTELGYDCRWAIFSAAEVGAPHIRKRWWLLAHAKSGRRDKRHENDRKSVRGAQNSAKRGRSSDCHQDVANAERSGLEGHRRDSGQSEITELGNSGSHVSDTTGARQLQRWRQQQPENSDPKWDLCKWATEPNVGRVANGIPARVDRVKCLGNSVVPLCAREAFKRLMGMDFIYT